MGKSVIIDLRIQAFWRVWHVRDLGFSWPVQVSSDTTSYRQEKYGRFGTILSTGEIRTFRNNVLFSFWRL